MYREIQYSGGRSAPPLIHYYQRKGDKQVMASAKETKEKPLEKLTAKELRVIAFEIPEITGVHGMNKSELISEIKKARGIEEKKEQKKSSSVRELKVKISELKIKRDEAMQAKDSKKASMLRRRISKLKKKTRHAA